MPMPCFSAFAINFVSVLFILYYADCVWQLLLMMRWWCRLLSYTQCLFSTHLQFREMRGFGRVTSEGLGMGPSGVQGLSGRAPG